MITCSYPRPVPSNIASKFDRSSKVTLQEAPSKAKRWLRLQRRARSRAARSVSMLHSQEVQLKGRSLETSQYNLQIFPCQRSKNPYPEWHSSTRCTTPISQKRSTVSKSSKEALRGQVLAIKRGHCLHRALTARTVSERQGRSLIMEPTAPLMSKLVSSEKQDRSFHSQQST